MVLQDLQRSKLDTGDDALFYDYPRFVTHVDSGFIQKLTDLYRQRLRSDWRILDLMSSWVSHLPEDLSFAHVEGHGLNGEELAANPRLDHYFVQNLNQDQHLSLGDQSFNAVLIAVSVQYLQYPESVFTEIHRILKPGGVVIISFSNRMFFQKAIQAWRDTNDRGRVQLVKQYLSSVSGFTPAEEIRTSPQTPLLSFLGVGSADPFYAVIAYRQEG